MIDIIVNTKPPIDKLPGGWEPTAVPQLSLENIGQAQYTAPYNIVVVEQLFSPEECEMLIDLMNHAPQLQPVNTQGKNVEPNQEIGSYRASIWSPKLAADIWIKLAPYLATMYAQPCTSTDWWQGDKDRHYWHPVGCSPLLRFMKYENNGSHLPHYDVGFIYPDDNYRTLQSVVVYLTTSKNGGATRFIRDDQGFLPVWQRNHDDWETTADPERIYRESAAITGNVLIFDHGKCHDVTAHLDDEPRIIIRMDIVFKAIANNMV
jgi:hypothetical protein